MSYNECFENYKKHIENLNAMTAHEQHIIEFRAMCAQMIEDAKAGIKNECMEEMKGQQQKKQDVQVRINMKDIKKQVIDAFKKAFK